MKATALILAIAGLTVTLATTPTLAGNKDPGVYCLFHYVGPNGNGHDYYAWYHNPASDCVNKVMTTYHHTAAHDYSFCDSETMPCILEFNQEKNADADRAAGKTITRAIEEPICRDTPHAVALLIAQRSEGRDDVKIEPFGSPIPYKIKTICSPDQEPTYKHILVFYYTIKYTQIGRETTVSMAFETKPDEKDPELDAGRTRWAANHSGKGPDISAEDRIELHFGNHLAVCFIASPLSEWICE